LDPPRRSQIIARMPAAPDKILLFVVARAVTWAALFIGAVLIYLPSTLVSRSGLEVPATVGVPQVAGLAIGTCGAALALWCVVTFAFVGRGTPAPFDPPRRLVIQGPYRLVRNPMSIGAVLALGGAALFYRSFAVLVYAGLFLLAMHLFVVLYEEPHLRQTFSTDYESYCQQAGRWWPRPERTSGCRRVT
jgi:protein-S-isoprenylcysteine O-methyltransferase Ste14